MSLIMQIHKVISVRLTPLREVATGTAKFYVQELIITDVDHSGEDTKTTISLFHNDRPAHAIDGEIVSKEPILLELDITKCDEESTTIEI